MRPTVRVASGLAALALVATTGARGFADPPPLEALAPRWDAGRVDAGTQVRHTYELRNHGSRVLQIAVKPSCGCTTADYDAEIPPGGTGHVTAVLDTTRMRGRVEKVIDVTTNDPAQPAITLTILAESVRALVVEPGDQPTVRGPFRALKPVELTVRAPGDVPFAITAVEDEPTLRATVAPFADDAPDAASGAHRRYRLTLTPGADLPVGAHHATVTLRTTAPGADRFTLPSTVVVTGPLVAFPPQLRIDAGKPSTAMRVTAADGAPFRVLRVTASDPDLAADATPVAGEPAWDVTVRYVGPANRHGQINTVVTVVTDEPAQPQLVVRVSGKL